VDHLQSTAAEPFYGLPDCTIHLKEPLPAETVDPNEE